MPLTSPFDDLIRKRAEEIRAEASRNPVDWSERLTWWQERVDQLYADIREWFRPLLVDNVVQCSEEAILIQEEQLGSYPLKKLALAIGTRRFDIVPVGTVIVGGFGRIDLTGPGGRAMLVLASPDDNLPPDARRAAARWYLVRPENRGKLAEVSEAVFKQVFSDLMSLSV